ncbi:sensor histidine kinase [Bradyrhizobium elkanii]|uniref:sensor histidine kinase n=1 Tax=Bradyrhizobium elkanii TaxID=29448 RepID=UPI0007A6BE23|nr:ATP-binding protein [Bradyrhizobium elkanii]
MKRIPHFLEINRPSILPLIAAILAIAIFILDTVTDLEIAAAVFYVAVVLMSVSFCQKRGVMLVGAACIALAILSYFLTRSGSPEAGLINCVISISAITATTYLVLKIDSARVAVYEARAQLAHIARVTALGELTASIAHEVNQPLAAVVTNGNAGLRWLTNQPPNVEKTKQTLERIVREANRASEIVGRIRNLAKKTGPQNERFNFNETVLETIALMLSEIQRNHVSLQTELQDDLPLVFGDRIQLQQVVLNLLVNAVEAMAMMEEGPHNLLVSTTNDNTRTVLFAVHDTGTGLEPDKLNRLFDAFYTTKLEGMGMGLAISRSIVEAHGGRIWATQNERRGAIFQFELPIRRAGMP